MKTLEADVGRLVSMMISEKRTRLEVGYFERSEVAGLARALGIAYLVRQSDAPWIEEVLADPLPRDHGQAPANARRRAAHLLMTGIDDEFAVMDAIHHIASKAPGRPPDLPAGITHAWTLAQFGGDHAALWSAFGGWDAIPLPPRPRSCLTPKRQDWGLAVVAS